MTLTDLALTLVSWLNWFSWFVAVTSVAMGLYSGWLFITARDNASQVALAQKTLLYTVIGIAVSVISFSIIALTKSLFP